MLTNLKKVGVSAFLFAPSLAFAQTEITDLLKNATIWVNSLTTIVVGLVFIYFIWGLIKYLTSGAEKKDEAKSQMIYSILIMFVIFSIWGIINLLGGLIGADSNTNAIDLDIPQVKNDATP